MSDDDHAASLCDTHRDRLDVSEGRLSNTDGNKGDGLVDPTHGRDIDSLSPDGTS